MKIAIILGTIGSIVLVLGIVFHLQGLSLVGPESSFMYSNPKWVIYGIEMIVIGIIIAGIGTGIKIIKRN